MSNTIPDWEGPSYADWLAGRPGTPALLDEWGALHADPLLWGVSPGFWDVGDPGEPVLIRAVQTIHDVPEAAGEAAARIAAELSGRVVEPVVAGLKGVGLVLLAVGALVFLWKE